MALPSVGSSISLQQVNTELGLSSNAKITLNDTRVRGLAGKTTSGSTISMYDLYGKKDTYTITISSSVANLTINQQWAKNNGWNGYAIVYVNINSGVTIYSNSTATPALMISETFPRGLYITNYGMIKGRGGDGGYGGKRGGPYPGAGSAGGVGLAFYVSGTYFRNGSGGWVAGGGGGGGGGGGFFIAGGGGGGGIGGSYGGACFSYGGASYGSDGTLTAAGAGGGGGCITVGGNSSGSTERTYYGGDGGVGGGYSAYGADGGGYKPAGAGAGGTAISGSYNSW